MAKKSLNIKPIRSAEELTALASEFLENQAAQKKLRKREDYLTEQLREHVNQTSETEISGLLEVYQRESAARLVSLATDTDMDLLKLKLLTDLAGSVFVKQSLDVTEMYKRQGYDPTLQKALETNELAIDKPVDWYFRRL